MSQTIDTLTDPSFHQPESTEQILAMHWEHDPDRHALRLVEPEGVQAVTVERTHVEVVLPPELPSDVAEQLATNLNVHTWRSEAEVLHLERGDEEAKELRDLADQATKDPSVLGELEARSGVALPALASGPTLADDVLTARWTAAGQTLRYDPPESLNAAGLRSEEPAAYSPALYGRDSVDQLANWMSLEAWGKEANDRLATVADGSVDQRELTKVRDLSLDALQGNADAAAELQARTGVDLDFDPGWVDKDLPRLKAEVSRHPTDPQNLLVPNSAPDSYGWMLDRFQEAGITPALGYAAENARGIEELDGWATTPEDLDRAVSARLLDQGFSEDDRVDAILKLSPGLKDRPVDPLVYAQEVAANPRSSARHEEPDMGYDGHDTP